MRPKACGCARTGILLSLGIGLLISTYYVEGPLLGQAASYSLILS